LKTLFVTLHAQYLSGDCNNTELDVYGYYEK